MQDTITVFAEGMPGELARRSLRDIAKPIGTRLSSQAVATAGLVVTATSGHKVPKIGATDCQVVANGVHVTIAAGTDMPALAGNITAGSFRIYCFFCDQAGNLTSVAGKEGTTMALATFPAFPEGKALVGYIIVTYASAFVANTTALDTATTIYVSPVGAFEPTILP